MGIMLIIQVVENSTTNYLRMKIVMSSSKSLAGEKNATKKTVSGIKITTTNRNSNQKGLRTLLKLLYLSLKIDLRLDRANFF